MECAQGDSHAVNFRPRKQKTEAPAAGEAAPKQTVKPAETAVPKAPQAPVAQPEPAKAPEAPKAEA